MIPILILVALAIFFLAFRPTKRGLSLHGKQHHHERSTSSIKKPTQSKTEKIEGSKISDRAKDFQTEHQSDWKTKLYKDLYYKIQNLEDFPGVLPNARQTLCYLLAEGLDIEHSKTRIRSILDIEDYSPEAAQQFLLAEHNHVATEWEQYSQRRAQGGGRELFGDRPSAVTWLKQHAPVKFVDGAWLGHIHKVTTPYALQGVTKDAWQVLSEELGDGDLEKNHVYLYRDLLKKIDIVLPHGYDAEFINPQHDLHDDLAWKAGTAQLLISLFPHEFLPEILGFNMHYELLTLQTLQAARELPELGIDGYYFILHVSIDNADSGHTAMALGTVNRYLEILQQQDPGAIPEVWKRIQAGYILSRTSDERKLLSNKEQRLVDMLRLKADASHQLHCRCRARIAQKPLALWLSPDNYNGTEECRRSFLDELANAKPWIIPGKSDKSLLMRELSWEGRMFGAFTNAEVQELRAWIDGLDNVDCDFEARYWHRLATLGIAPKSRVLQPAQQDVAVHHPVLEIQPPPALSSDNPTVREWTMVPELGPLTLGNASFDAIVALWFAHPCVLENMVNTPYRTANPLASTIIRILRAESGFLEEAPVVAGMDEQLRTHDNLSLVAVGLEMLDRAGRPLPASLGEILGTAAQIHSPAVAFSRKLLTLALRPVSNESKLIAIGLAFLDFEVAVESSDGLLSTHGARALRRIINRKKVAFSDCLNLLKERDTKGFGQCVQHYVDARQELEEALKI